MHVTRLHQGWPKSCYGVRSGSARAFSCSWSHSSLSSSFTSRFAAKLQCQHTPACVRARSRSCTSTQCVPAGASPTWQAITQAALQALTERVLTQLCVQDGSGRPRQRRKEPTLCVHCSCTSVCIAGVGRDVTAAGVSSARDGHDGHWEVLWGAARVGLDQRCFLRQAAVAAAAAAAAVALQPLVLQFCNAMNSADNRRLRRMLCT